MRAQFNTTGDFINGPSAPSPDVIRFTGPCRVVYETQELPQDDIMSQRVAYITTEAGVPAGPFVTGGPELYGSDYAFADRIAVPTGTIPIYEVLFVELVLPVLTSPYYRSHVRWATGISPLAQETLWPILQEDGSLLLLP